MKKFIGACLISIASYTQAAPQTLEFEAFCETTEIVFKKLVEFKEVPFLLGKAEDEASSIMTFWVNARDKTWTITSTKGNLTCIIGYGDNLNLAKIRLTGDL